VKEIRRRRVPALAPEARRAALIQATVPLLHECGLDVSTRQIAAAAGVAEGTIFGVFKDKNSLVVAALMHALDPAPTLEAIAAIDPAKDLRRRLAEAADLINDRFTGNVRLMSAARTLIMSGGDHDAARRMARSREQMLAALTAVIEPDAAALRRSPETTARLLLLFVGANTHGPFGDPDGFTGAEMASLLLDGLLIVTDRDRAPVVHLPGKTDTC
jgi:AcrR family transcriptional regulator